MINFRMLSLKVAIVLGMYFLSTLLVNSCTQQKAEAKGSLGFWGPYSKGVIEHDGYEYLVFFKSDGTTQTGYALSVVNLTKERLEIELLKKQLNENSRRK